MGRRDECVKPNRAPSGGETRAYLCYHGERRGCRLYLQRVSVEATVQPDPAPSGGLTRAYLRYQGEKCAWSCEWRCEWGVDGGVDGGVNGGVNRV